MVDANNKLSPFVIWTLQRTGGTNLTQRLVERSGLAATQHEPFNRGRVYGEVTQAWIDNNDEVALARSMLEIATRRGIIKHCVEMVPWEVTRALIKATTQVGYSHLFLYREQARDRLLSLHFAQKTGVWGPNMKKEEIQEEVLAEPIPIERLLRHEEKCVNRLEKTWRLLVEQGAHPVALSYEAIYRSTPETAGKKLKPVLESLGLASTPAEDHAFVMEVLGNGDQGTRDKYHDIPGVNELEEALKDVPCFTPEAPHEEAFAIERSEMPEWVLRAQIDSLPHLIPASDTFVIGGVIVVGQNAPEGLTLHLTGSAGDMDIRWDIDSQKMKKLYPGAKNSARARFKSGGINYVLNEDFSLHVKDAQGNTYPLFRFAIQPSK
jgi:hypothetical protein